MHGSMNVKFQNRYVKMKLYIFLQPHKSYDYNESIGSPNKNESPLFIFLNAQFHINHKETWALTL
jgi:hypothetical protein